MTKLLSANLIRLKKDKIFYVCLAFMFIFGSYIMINSGLEAQKYREYGMSVSAGDALLFPYISVAGILIAIFGGLFLGTEYGDGTIRNKIIAGQSRTKIYFANFITCFIAGVFMCLAFLIPAAIFGLILLGFSMNIFAILALILLSLLTVAALTSIVVLMCMLNQNRALSAVLVIVILIALMFAAIIINARLAAPEFYDGYVFEANSDDDIVPALNENVPNPEYLTPEERKVYQFFLDLLPTGQAVQISSASVPNPITVAVCAVSVTLLCCAAGIIAFKRMDLK